MTSMRGGGDGDGGDGGGGGGGGGSGGVARRKSELNNFFLPNMLWWIKIM